MFVYIVYNTVNGKVYIGKTKGTIENRWQNHIRAAKKGSNLMLHKAIRKYGIEAFQVSRLSAAVSSAQLDDLERFFITKHRSYPPEFGYGYNMSPGGEGGAEIRIGKKQTPEARHKVSEYRKKNPVVAGSETAKKISSALKGRVFIPEWSAKKSEAQRGEKNPQFKNLIDSRFGKLLVSRWVGGGRWRCVCDCGKVSTVLTNNLLRKNGTKSCGCTRKPHSEETRQKLRAAALRRRML